MLNLHLRVDDPVKVFLALVLSTRSTLHSTEQTGLPVHTLICALGSLISLSVLDLGLLVCRSFVIPGDDSLDCIVP